MDIVGIFWIVFWSIMLVIYISVTLKMGSLFPARKKTSYHKNDNSNECNIVNISAKSQNGFRNLTIPSTHDGSDNINNETSKYNNTNSCPPRHIGSIK